MSGWHRWDGADLVLTLRVQPRASRDELRLDGARLKARITAPPVDGAANAHLLRFLAAEFGVAPSRAELVRGATGREKVVRIAAPKTLPAPLASGLARRP
ncbi:MAG TPA: DUF167 family protein [Steroidobacteraceae bacterium]|nr:DUF167 family protein [Steroidobacteraceae bacterium]